MNYNLEATDFAGTYAEDYSPAYWDYTVVPRVPEDPAYIADLDFAMPPLANLTYYGVTNGSILEVFRLTKRVLITGLKIEVVVPVEGLVIQPVTHSGVFFDAIDCGVLSARTLRPFGGTLDRDTDLLLHSFRIEEPDYLGLKLVTGAAGLGNLALNVQLAVSDTFSLDTLSNSTKDT